MAKNVFDFRWSVQEEGYEWISVRQVVVSEGEMAYEKCSNSNGEALLALSKDIETVNSSGYLHRDYSPLETPVLFRVFSETSPTPEGIQAFANQYGLLGGDIEMEVWVPTSFSDMPDEEGRVLYSGELMDHWTKEITAMREAVELWDLARLGKVREILGYKSKMIHDESRPVDQSAYYEDGGEQIQLGDSDWLDRRDIVHSTLSHVERIVNSRLRNRIQPMLLWVSNPNIHLSMRYIPKGLIGVLWLQLAQAIDGNKDFRQCLECKKWFELTPEVARTNRYYCSTACRSKAYRKRQDEAFKLHQDGMQDEKIAEKLSSDLETIRGWIKKKEQAISGTKG